MSFPRDKFLDWLDEQDEPIPQETLKWKWPAFPEDELFGCTGPIVDGKKCYYRHDLRKVAEGKEILD